MASVSVWLDHFERVDLDVDDEGVEQASARPAGRHALGQGAQVELPAWSANSCAEEGRQRLEVLGLDGVQQAVDSGLGTDPAP